MSLVINTNVSSLTAQRAIAGSKNELETAMERLSTGSKINSASDDAAGLAMTQRMTAQIQGLNMAIKNSNDGIAMTKSIEGAITEVSDMLQRMRELSIQAANGTNSASDRTYLQDEVNLLIQDLKLLPFVRLTDGIGSSSSPSIFGIATFATAFWCAFIIVSPYI